MCQGVKPVQQGRYDSVLQWPPETETHVHPYPHHDAWVAWMALYGGDPLIHQSLFRLRRVLLKVRHLGPDQEAHSIRPIQPAGVFNFLVLARPVEAEGFRELDVSTQIGVGRGCVPTARIVSLVQHQSLNVGLTVQEETPGPRPHTAQAEITLDPVDVAAGIIDEPDG